MEVDKELERIKLKKLRDMFRRRTSKKRPEEPQEQGKSATNQPVEVTDASFTETIHNHPLVVVDCWASWCAPCHMIAPIIGEMARDYAGKIFFGKLNVDENKRVTMQYQIMSIPTLLLFKNGKLVDRIIGAMPRQMLESRITRYI